MTHLFVILNIFICSAAYRSRTSRHRDAAGAWTTTTDADHGACAQHLSKGIFSRPIYFPLLCSSGSDAVVLQVTTSVASFGQFVNVSVNGEFKGRLDFLWPQTKELALGSLPSGLHSVSLSGGSWDKGVMLGEVTAKGASGGCSFDQAPSQARDASIYTYDGFDTMNAIFGERGNFSEFKKQQLYFASETVGKTEDGSIDSTVVAEGVWKWVYQFSQKQPSNDQWGHKGVMWDESNIRPYPEVSLNNLPRHFGQKMIVQEPCGSLSNWAFHQATVWVSCKGYALEKDEIASLMAAFNGLAAGSFFLHACACDTGSRMDTFTMDWLMLQIYQSMVQQVITDAGDHLTEAEKTAIFTFGNTNIGKATDLAKDMTRLFSQKYDHAVWNATVRAIDIPAYDKPIAGVISFVMWSLQDLIGHGTDGVLKKVLDTLMDAFGIPDKEFFNDVYTPAVRKALSFSNLCPEAVPGAVEYTLKFILTFVEALVFQEKKLPVPKSIRDVVYQLSALGYTHDLYADMVDSWDYYNGFDCHARADHSMWHEKAAHGLIHFINVAEYYRTGVGC